MRTILIVAALVAALPAAGQEPVLLGGVRECVARNLAAGDSLSDCIANGQSACLAHTIEDPAAVTCYQSAKAEWGALITELVDGFAGKPDNFQDVARIESRYAITRNVLDCGRRIELSLIGREADTSDVYARARCEAQAVGAAYVEMLVATGAVESP